MRIYHNPLCTKSRETLKLLRDAGVEPEIVEYLKTPPSAAELDRILKMLGMEPQQVMRTKEKAYKQLGLDKKPLSRKEAIRVLVENPVLIERPIVVAGKRAVLGRPPENVRQLL